jgi:hypothetical protein
MFAVGFGVDEAMEAAGYGQRCDDFGFALHVALTNASEPDFCSRGEFYL